MSHHDLIAQNMEEEGGGGIDPATLSPFAQLIAGDITGFNDGDTINTAWPDSSGKGHTFNPTGGVTFQTNEFNGESVVRFDGSTGSFVTSEANTTWRFLHTTNGHTVFVIFKIRLANPGIIYVIMDSSGVSSATHGYAMEYRDTGSSPFIDAIFLFITKGSSGNPVIDQRIENAITPQQIQIITETYDFGKVGDDSELLVNAVSVGTQETINAPLAFNAAYDFRLGRRASPTADRYLDADVAEYCFFDKVLTPAERAGVEAFYANKYQ